MFRIYFKIYCLRLDDDNYGYSHLIDNGYLEANTIIELFKKIKDLADKNNNYSIYSDNDVGREEGDTHVDFDSEIFEIVGKTEFDYEKSDMFEIRKKEVEKIIEDETKRRIENEVKEKELSRIREIKNLEERLKQLKEEQ